MHTSTRTKEQRYWESRDILACERRHGSEPCTLGVEIWVTPSTSSERPQCPEGGISIGLCPGRSTMLWTITSTSN